MDAPVGTIVASMLDEAQFQAQPNIGKAWVLARGQSAAGTGYAQITHNQMLPDLRGVFLRGANADLAPPDQQSRGNPENKKVGDYQGDDFKSHTHQYGGPNGDDGNRAGHQDAWYQHRDYQTGAAGGAETRPRNVTVNYFIKIN